MYIPYTRWVHAASASLKHRFQLAALLKSPIVNFHIQPPSAPIIHKTTLGILVSVMVVPIGAAAGAPNFNTNLNGAIYQARTEVHTLLQVITDENVQFNPSDPSRENTQFQATEASLQNARAVADGLGLGGVADSSIIAVTIAVDALQNKVSVDQGSLGAIQSTRISVDKQFAVLIRDGCLPWLNPARTTFPVTMGQVIVLIFVTGIVTLLVAIPPCTFLIRGWPTKRKQITNVFDPATCQYYFSKYWVNEALSKTSRKNWKLGQIRGDAPSLVSELDPNDPAQARLLSWELVRIYQSYFGRSLYILPVILLLLVTFCSSGFLIRSALYKSQTMVSKLPAEAPHVLLNYVAISAIVGAYLWIAGDGLRRMRINDYLPSNVYAHVLRMVVAIPLGFAIGSMGNSALGPFLAFAIGVFPLETVTRFIRAGASKAMSVTDDADTDGDEIKRLIGVNNDVAHRLVAEDVATILDLAKCDPIRVMMRTNLDFDVVLDLMNQAIVAVAIMMSSATPTDGAQKIAPQLIDILRVSGLGRASQIKVLIDQKDVPEGLAAKLLWELPGLTGLKDAQVRYLFTGISTDEKTVLVCRLLAAS